MQLSLTLQCAAIVSETLRAIPSMGICASISTGEWGWEVRGVPGWLAGQAEAPPGGVCSPWAGLREGALACTPPSSCRAAEASEVRLVKSSALQLCCPWPSLCVQLPSPKQPFRENGVHGSLSHKLLQRMFS